VWPWPVNTTIIQLQGNRLERIEPGSFGVVASTLQSLSLQNNDITILADGTLDGLTALTSLDIGSNSITQISLTALNSLTSLQVLRLYNNLLVSLQAGVLNGLRALTHLDASKNHLQVLPAGLMSDLTALRSLNLNYNKLNDLPFAAMSGLSSVRDLLVGGNNVTVVPNGAFRDSGLTSIENLYLFGNDLRAVTSGSFDGMNNLSELYLFTNNITVVDNGMFTRMASLQQVLFGDNPLYVDGNRSAGWAGVPPCLNISNFTVFLDDGSQTCCLERPQARCDGTEPAEPTLTAGAIAAIVIFVFALFIIAFLLLMRRNKTRPKSAPQAGAECGIELPMIINPMATNAGLLTSEDNMATSHIQRQGPTIARTGESSTDDSNFPDVADDAHDLTSTSFTGGHTKNPHAVYTEPTQSSQPSEAALAPSYAVFQSGVARGVTDLEGDAAHPAMVDVFTARAASGPVVVTNHPSNSMQIDGLETTALSQSVPHDAQPNLYTPVSDKPAYAEPPSASSGLATGVDYDAPDGEQSSEYDTVGTESSDFPAVLLDDEKYVLNTAQPSSTVVANPYELFRGPDGVGGVAEPYAVFQGTSKAEDMGASNPYTKFLAAGTHDSMDEQVEVEMSAIPGGDVVATASTGGATPTSIEGAVTPRYDTPANPKSNSNYTKFLRETDSSAGRRPV